MYVLILFYQHTYAYLHFSILNYYLSEDSFKKIKIQLNSFFDSNRIRTPTYQISADRRNSTFGRFEDEDLELEIMDHENVDLLVDQMIEPLDIIWSNIGGGRGLFICRRIFLSLLGIFILLFLSTPAVLFL